MQVLGGPLVEGALFERRVVVGVSVPRPVQIVRHDVDKVEASWDAAHVVAFVDTENSWRNGGRQQPAALSKRRRHFLDERCEVVLVRPLTVTIGRTYVFKSFRFIQFVFFLENWNLIDFNINKSFYEFVQIESFGYLFFKLDRF